MDGDILGILAVSDQSCLALPASMLLIYGRICSVNVIRLRSGVLGISGPYSSSVTLRALTGFYLPCWRIRGQSLGVVR